MRENHLKSTTFWKQNLVWSFNRNTTATGERNLSLRVPFWNPTPSQVWTTHRLFAKYCTWTTSWIHVLVYSQREKTRNWKTVLRRYWTRFKVWLPGASACPRSQVLGVGLRGSSLPRPEDDTAFQHHFSNCTFLQIQQLLQDSILSSHAQSQHHEFPSEARAEAWKPSQYLSSSFVEPSLRL